MKTGPRRSMKNPACALACALGIALMLAACGRAEREAATLQPPAAQGTTISSSADPATANPTSPEVTASSAAAAAPECRDMKDADPAACEPDATGNPNAPADPGPPGPEPSPSNAE
jgi:hypothetical protein